MKAIELKKHKQSKPQFIPICFSKAAVVGQMKFRKRLNFLAELEPVGVDSKRRT